MPWVKNLADLAKGMRSVYSIVFTGLMIVELVRYRIKQARRRDV